MKKILVSLFILGALASCKKKEDPKKTETVDSKFEKYKEHLDRKSVV